jgi:hypothetical protein
LAQNHVKNGKLPHRRHHLLGYQGVGFHAVHERITYEPLFWLREPDVVHRFVQVFVVVNRTSDETPLVFPCLLFLDGKIGFKTEKIVLRLKSAGQKYPNEQASKSDWNAHSGAKVMSE